MAAVPNSPLVPVEEYLHTSYPDGDREYLDGVIVERNLGTPGHSALQTILILHFGPLQREFQIAVRAECRLKVEENRYRIPDVLVMARSSRQTQRVILDAPLIVIEILSPDDNVKDTLRRFRDYEQLGVRHIVQMDPEDRTTFTFVNGDLLRRDLTGFEIPGRGTLPFDSCALLALLDEE